MNRINSIDYVRGLVMIIMALDHVRDLMHVTSLTQNPTDLSTTTPALFFTRWVTHLCAPTFVFLAGTSAFLNFKSQANLSQSRYFLLTRGLWLILLEVTVVNFGLWFDPGFHTLLFQVIGAIGFGFIVLGLLLSVSPTILGLLGVIIIFCHNLLPLIPFAEGSVAKAVLSPFFAPGAFPISAHTVFIMGYPPVPWLGVMLAGFGSGQVFEWEAAKRKAVFLKTGAAAITLFILLRCYNTYGDPAAWSVQQDPMYSFLSFINVTKYPPSLLFCLSTLGIMFLLLVFLEPLRNRLTRVFSVYGKVPLFYFIVHFYVIHLAMIAMLLMQGFHWSDLDFGSGTFGRPKGVESGVSLWTIYGIWIGVVSVLYLPCRWFGRYKSTHKQWWLRYL